MHNPEKQLTRFCANPKCAYFQIEVPAEQSIYEYIPVEQPGNSITVATIKRRWYGLRNTGTTADLGIPLCQHCTVADVLAAHGVQAYALDPTTPWQEPKQ